MRAVGTSICITMIVTSIFSLLVTSHSMERVLKFTLSLFFLTVLLYPLQQVNIGDLFTLSIAQEQNMLEKQSQLETGVAELTTLQLESQAKTLLAQEGIDCKKVEITIHNSDETGITISRLFVLLNDAGVITATEDCLQTYYGIVPEIEVNASDD